MLTKATNQYNMFCTLQKRGIDMNEKIKQIKQIKQFNRFYLRKMALHAIYTDVSSYSATEAMILHEIAHVRNCTASYLSEYFMFDKGYISRILRKLSNNESVIKEKSTTDKRIHYLKITPKGNRDLEQLSKLANKNVSKMIEDVEEDEVKELIQAMQTIEKLL